MDEALLSIMLTSDGAVASYRSPIAIVKQSVDRTDAKQRTLADARPYAHGSRGRPELDPRSDLGELIDDLSTRFMGARTHRARLEVIREAQHVAIRIRYAPNRSQVRGTTEWRSAIANDPRPSAVLAEIYGVGASTVKRIKRQAGTNSKRGRPKGPRLATV